MVKTTFVALLLLLPMQGSAWASSATLSSLLEQHGAEYVSRAKAEGGSSSEVFQRYVGELVHALRSDGETVTAERIVSAFSPENNMTFSRVELAWIIHTFALEYYRDQILRHTSRLIGFRTFKNGTPNRINPEFVRQREYLDSLAHALGLHFNDVDGVMQEIWVGNADQSFGLMVHGDVQPADSVGWTLPPWQGTIRNERLWGRGSMDDKGPLIAIMYGMRAILDSGLPLKRKIMLLVGSDEESDNTDLATYLKNHNAPDRTVVVDMKYPVIAAEKGWCGIWLQLPRTTLTSSGRYFMVVGMNAGISPSIIPNRATAALLASGLELDQAFSYVQSLAGKFVEQHAGSNITVNLNADTLVVVALGTSVHSSIPESGHNALTDLAMFLDGSVQPFMNEFGLMSRFLAEHIGFGMDGTGLRIAHDDPFMGGVTVAPTMFTTTDSTVMLMVNFRIPKGITTDEVRDSLAVCFRAFDRRYGVTLDATEYLTDAHYVDPGEPFVQNLLSIYNSITHDSSSAGSIGGATYAHRLPNAVVFGPAMPDEPYTGHSPNESIRLSTLERNVEILTHTMVEFGM
jgi:predicted dipeptidase